MIPPEGWATRGHSRSDADRLWPRRHSRTPDTDRALAHLDPPVADYARDGVVRTVRIARTTPRRADVLHLRRAHHRRTLDRLGVPVWDEDDERAVHLLCTEGDTAVGALRVTVDRAGEGELYEDFGHEEFGHEYFGQSDFGHEDFGRGDFGHDDFGPLHRTLGDAELLMFARQIVQPRRRGSEVATALAHAACLWWSVHSRLRRIAFTGITPAAPAPVFGATAVTPPLALGPACVAVAVFTGRLDTVADETARRLLRTGWSITLREALGTGGAAGAAVDTAAGTREADAPRETP
ncbi:hypothetical protein HUT19_38205 [Streptomyces sp. NA02950]|uniref:hypothetical protein n=1 Tax=Streptomyces sp. NA02950 TaxID=2742137 RepID=UPI00159018CD|nr:hypothetical protein [Streptomyces sp. NA02950]QKV96817.1 hypothetical protein HUT19_38205 [Streptomyces sp. NA02950]